MSSSRPARDARRRDPRAWWTAARRLPGGSLPGLAMADIDLYSPDPGSETALRLVRPWRRTARAGLYGGHIVVGDSRSDTRTEF